MKEIIPNIECEKNKVELKNFKYDPDKIYILEQELDAHKAYGQLTRNRSGADSLYVFKHLFYTENWWSGAIEISAHEVFASFLAIGNCKIYEFNKNEFIKWFKETF